MITTASTASESRRRDGGDGLTGDGHVCFNGGRRGDNLAAADNQINGAVAHGIRPFNF